LPLKNKTNLLSFPLYAVDWAEAEWEKKKRERKREK
jgi:hypothetical protein